MKTSLLIALFVSLALACAANPIRVLYLGTRRPRPRMTCHVLMQELGRDAIWFDYTSDPQAVTREWLAKFDASCSTRRREKFKNSGPRMPARKW